MPIQSQGIITRDNVSVDVSAVAYYKVVDAEKSVVAIENVRDAIGQIAQTTLRKVVGQHTLDQILSETDTIKAHPLALQLRNLQSLVEIGVDKNTTVVFPAPLMSTIAELGSFLASEQAAATRVPPPRSDPNTLSAAPAEPPMRRDEYVSAAADGLPDRAA